MRNGIKSIFRSKSWKLIVSFIVGFVALNCLGQNIVQCGQESLIKTLKYEKVDLDGSSSLQSHGKFDSNILFKEAEVKVVFHILYSNEDQNIHDSLIHNAVRVLNQAFYDCLDEVDSNFEDVKGCPKLFFTVVKDDQNGISNGITRNYTSVKTFNTGLELFEYDSPKYTYRGGRNAFKSQECINIWVCNLKPENNNFQYVSGYAFPPSNAKFWSKDYFVSSERQGIVIDYRCLLPRNLSTEYNPLGIKTLVHEMGHFFGLLHIWGHKEGCDNDDFIDDTPNCAKPSHFCSNNRNSCDANKLNDQYDNSENYMDYTNENCARMFSIGQAHLIRHNLFIYRTSIGNFKQTLELDSFLCFPNPATDYINVVIPTHVSPINQAQIRVYSLNGSLITKKSITSNEQIILLSTLHFPKGLYFVECELGNKYQHFKLLVQR
ncbi:MAG: hypothetical protein ACI8ZM_005642 [Crocinitomix sp.]|jgi:hypothetical protein